MCYMQKARYSQNDRKCVQSSKEHSLTLYISKSGRVILTEHPQPARDMAVPLSLRLSNMMVEIPLTTDAES
jgi:hypothetical protein